MLEPLAHQDLEAQQDFKELLGREQQEQAVLQGPLVLQD